MQLVSVLFKMDPRTWMFSIKYKILNLAEKSPTAQMKTSEVCFDTRAQAMVVALRKRLGYCQIMSIESRPQTNTRTS